MPHDAWPSTVQLARSILLPLPPPWSTWDHVLGVVSIARGAGYPWKTPLLNHLTGRSVMSARTYTSLASLAEAQAIIEAWQMDYDHHRLHSSLGHLTPTEFIDQFQVISTVEAVLWFG